MNKNCMVTSLHACLLLVICLSLNTASSRAESSVTNVPLAVLGLGLRNEVELGMTLDQAKQKRPDLVVATHGSGLESVTSYSGKLATLGLEVQVIEKAAPISAITLMVDPTLTTNRFSGTLSCGFDFQRGQSIQRSDVLRMFGKPLDSQGTNILRHLQAGRSVAWKPDSKTEILYYPSSGVIYRLRNGTVNAVTIIPIRTDSPNHSKVQRIKK